MAKGLGWINVMGLVAIIAGASYVALGPTAGPLGCPKLVNADPKDIKYTGAGACAAGACHGSPAPREDGATRHNENVTWSKKDAHAKAFTDGDKKGLGSADSKKIADALKIADATKSERCLSCHGTSGLSIGEGVKRFAIPAALQDAASKFNVADGVSCDSCHGPASKYLPSHTTAGWTAGQRKALGSVKLYDTEGLYDTKNLKFRANDCISCHLKIDADMLTAGHPRLPFELNEFSDGNKTDKDEKWIHWRDKDKFYGGKVWAMGQTISLREAALAAAEYVKAKAPAAVMTASVEQVKAHGIMSQQIAAWVDAGAAAELSKALGAALKSSAEADFAALAKAADAMADKLNDKAIDQGAVETLLKNVAAEGEQLGASGFAGGEQFAYGLSSLYSTLIKDAAADAKKKDGIDALFDPLGDPGTYKKDDFVKAAKALAGTFAGGKSIPLP